MCCRLWSTRLPVSLLFEAAVSGLPRRRRRCSLRVHCVVEAGAAIPRVEESLADAPLSFCSKYTAAPHLPLTQAPCLHAKEYAAGGGGIRGSSHQVHRARDKGSAPHGPQQDDSRPERCRVAAFQGGLANLFSLRANSPNYGQSGSGYVQRVGAAAVCDFMESTFGDSMLSPLLHEDPRFYPSSLLLLGLGLTGLSALLRRRWAQ